MFPSFATDAAKCSQKHRISNAFAASRRKEKRIAGSEIRLFFIGKPFLYERSVGIKIVAGNHVDQVCSACSVKVILLSVVAGQAQIDIVGMDDDFRIRKLHGKIDHFAFQRIGLDRLRIFHVIEEGVINDGSSIPNLVIKKGVTDTPFSVTL